MILAISTKLSFVVDLIQRKFNSQQINIMLLKMQKILGLMEFYWKNIHNKDSQELEDFLNGND